LSIIQRRSVVPAIIMPSHRRHPDTGGITIAEAAFRPLAGKPTPGAV